jgi:hypothetical protein
MFTVVRTRRNGVILWISQNGTYNSKLCEFIGFSNEKGVMPEKVQVK